MPTVGGQPGQVLEAASRHEAGHAAAAEVRASPSAAVNPPKGGP